MRYTSVVPIVVQCVTPGDMTLHLQISRGDDARGSWEMAYLSVATRPGWCALAGSLARATRLANYCGT
jgi:hypothetical protein